MQDNVFDHDTKYLTFVMLKAVRYLRTQVMIRQEGPVELWVFLSTCGVTRLVFGPRVPEESLPGQAIKSKYRVAFLADAAHSHARLMCYCASWVDSLVKPKTH